MKRALVVALLFVAAFAFGQDVTYVPDGNATLIWDDVGAESYEVGRSVAPVADRTAPDIIIGVASGPELPIVIPDDTEAYAYAVRSVVGAGVSRWVWTDEEGIPSPFVYRSRPAAPTGLRTTVP